jgi:SAM-dependent methyltransferase
MKPDLAKLDRAFEEFKESHPGATFAEFSARQISEEIGRGEFVSATLGTTLRNHPDWWTAGAKLFARYLELFGITQNTKVVDYGCGSLRVGAHFIKHLAPGGYVGLDVVSDFYEMGKQVIGHDLIHEKRPTLAVISAASLADAAAFGADFVYSSAVAPRVHPDELQEYLRNLAAIAHKPGAVLVVHAALSDATARFKRFGWSHPLPVFEQGLAPLRFAREHSARKKNADGHAYTLSMLEFRAPA